MAAIKTIGLIGGMSWESTVTYYRLINEYVKDKLSGFHSARIVLYSVEFAEIEQCQDLGQWDKSADILSEAAVALEKAGADMILICTNTMHKVLPQVAARVNVPFLHIADAAADELAAKGIRKAALLGTKYTMTQDFYTGVLAKRGIETIIPVEPDITFINHVIYDELCLGVVSEDSRREFVRIINELTEKGAGGVVLGCTEIGLLVNQNDVAAPVFDTAVIHALRAAEIALEGA